jgi:hypothetical protein
MTMRFALADRSHDAPLRALMAADSLPGWVRLRFTREPSFFDGVAPQGHTNQVVALFDGEEIVGMGCRSIRTVFLDGEPREFGYLSALRSMPRVRLGTLLGRGYRFLRELHRDGLVPGYLTTIVERNRGAIAILTSGRAGLPTYLPLGRCYAYAIPVRRGPRRRAALPKGIRVESGAAIEPDALEAFLIREGARRQFFPTFESAALGRPPYGGLAAGDFRVALRDGGMVGVAAVWDQRRFRQTRVAGYAPPLRMLRPLLNMPARLAGYHTLPPPGGPLNMAYLSFLCIRDDDPDYLAALLSAILTEHAAGDLQFLCLALHETAPLNATLRSIRHVRFDSRLYLVCWEDTRAECEALRNGRMPHVELAML